MSIRTKFSIYLILLVILPILASSTVIYSYASTVIETKSREVAFQSFRQTRSHIQEIVSNVDNLSYKIFSNDDVQQLSNLNDQDREYLFVGHTNRINYFLSQELRMYPYVHSVIIKKDEQILYHIGGLKDIIDAPKVQEAIDRKGVPLWTRANPLTTDNSISEDTYVISLVRAINDINRFKVISVQMIHLREDALRQAYDIENVWKDEEMFIIDNQGFIISAVDKKRIGKNMETQPYIQNLMKKREGYINTMFNGISSSVLFYSIDSVGWRVVKIIPDSSFNQSQIYIRILTLTMIGICLIFGLIFSFIQYNGIIKPIKNLKREMDKMKRGNFDVRVQTKQKDEIGQLSFYFEQMGQELKLLIEKIYHSRLKEKEAKLQILSMQINPHFLYNTLDSIRWMALKYKVEPIAEQLEALSNMFRYSLRREVQFTMIQEEVKHVENYMFIQNFRFDHKYNIEMHVDEEALLCESPHFLLQPLVENSIQHGFEGKDDQGKIQITIQKVKRLIWICVEDNGHGADEEYVRQLLANESGETGYALRNIHTRIQLKYGSNYGLSFYSQETKGTRVEIKLPAITKTMLTGGREDENADC